MGYYFLQAYSIHDWFFLSQKFYFSEVGLVYYKANLDVLFVIIKCYVRCFTMKLLYYTEESFHLLMKL